MSSFVNAVNPNQYDEIFDDEIFGFDNTTKFPTTKFLMTKFLATKSPLPVDSYCLEESFAL